MREAVQSDGGGAELQAHRAGVAGRAAPPRVLQGVRDSVRGGEAAKGGGGHFAAIGAEGAAEVSAVRGVFAEV